MRGRASWLTRLAVSGIMAGGLLVSGAGMAQATDNPAPQNPAQQLNLPNQNEGGDKKDEDRCKDRSQIVLVSNKDTKYDPCKEKPKCEPKGDHKADDKCYTPPKPAKPWVKDLGVKCIDTTRFDDKTNTLRGGHKFERNGWCIGKVVLGASGHHKGTKYLPVKYRLTDDKKVKYIEVKAGDSVTVPYFLRNGEKKNIIVDVWVPGKYGKGGKWVCVEVLKWTCKCICAPPKPVPGKVFFGYDCDTKKVTGTIAVPKNGEKTKYIVKLETKTFGGDEVNFRVVTVEPGKSVSITFDLKKCKHWTITVYKLGKHQFNLKQEDLQREGERKLLQLTRVYKAHGDCKCDVPPCDTKCDEDPEVPVKPDTPAQPQAPLKPVIQPVANPQPQPAPQTDPVATTNRPQLANTGGTPMIAIVAIGLLVLGGTVLYGVRRRHNQG